MSDRDRNAGAPPSELWLLRPEAGGSLPRVFGLSLAERLTRSARAAGIALIREVAGEAPAPHAASEQVLLLRADCLLDDRLLRALALSPSALLLARAPGAASSGRPLAACVPAARAAELQRWLAGDRDPRQRPACLRALAPAELVPAYSAALRKSQPPFAFDAGDASQPFDPARVEELLFRASYKGLTDLVTKWLWPAPALACVRRLADLRVRPNSVTALSWAITILATWLFYRGDFGLGLCCAWLMTFLDTVDGKLARCTLTSSPIGNVLDHGLDLVHPPFWWLAYGAGLGAGHEVATAIAIAGYFLGRLQEGLFLLRHRIEIHTWRPLDGVFRTVTARRNPNLLLFSVGVAGGRPDLGLEMVAVWTLASFAFHCVRIAQAELLRRAGGEVRPWDEAIPAEPRPSARLPDRAQEVREAR